MIKKTFSPIVLFLCSIYSMMDCYAQTNARKTDFHILGRITGRDTGKVVIWYTNRANEGTADTATLNGGQFTFSGNINAASEALIWTNIQNIDFDDQSVIRLILEPGIIHISKIEGIKKATITGSHAQDEMVKWESVNASLLEAEDRCLETYLSLNKRNQQAGGSLFKIQMDSLRQQLDSIWAIHAKLDIGYVAKHPESYLSGYLLSQRYKRIPVDSVKLLYIALADSVKNSSVGYDVLSYVYPLTDDNEFRMKYPLIDKEFSKRLAGIKSIYEFKLSDTSGKMVDFATFRGKYLLIDVWASWCKPCIENVPAWNDLLKRYDPNVIQFVSVSMDTRVNAWKKSVGQHKPGGLTLIEQAAFKSMFAMYCKVRRVPTYIIADPAGRIINYDAHQPIDPALRSLLDKLIKK